jgi:hypothetical protein
LRYGFNDGNKEFIFVVLGQFNSPEEAKRINSNLIDMDLWNMVSPEQSLNWIKK